MKARQERFFILVAFVFLGGVSADFLIKNLGRVISRADIPQDDFARFKTIAEDISIADRINQVIEE